MTVKKSGSSSSNSNNGNSSTSFDANAIIKKYYSQNPQYTKVSDGNGTFNKLNGHATSQTATVLMTGTMTNDHAYMATGGSKQYNYIWHVSGTKFQSIAWDNAINLSFTDTVFQTGETCGVLRVLNGVPGSSYTFTSSNSNIVSLNSMQDPSAVRINAKSQGEVTITCKISFRNGESKTLTSHIRVSDTVGNNIKNGTVNMNSVMERIANAYRSNKNVNWIPDVISTQQAVTFGNTCLGSYSSYDIYYSEIDENTMENMYNPNNKYLNNPEEYIVYSGSQIFSNSYFMVEYQGHNDNGIQLAQVGVLSIPTVK